VAGLNAVKRGPHRHTNRLSGASFTATGLDPAHLRTLVFLHAEKKVAAAVTVRGDERVPLTVRLDRPGAVTGRLVDARCQPIQGATVFVRYGSGIEPTLPGELIMGGLGDLRDAIAIPSAKTDRAGRFRLEGLVPGLKYELEWNDRADRFLGRRKAELSATPGKVVDLGDLRPG